MRHLEIFLAIYHALFLLPSPSRGQYTPLDQFFNISTFPNEQTKNVTRYLSEAASLATDSAIHQYFVDLCIAQSVYPSLFIPPTGFVEPFSPFENFFFVGHSFVTSWAYDTGEGLVLIDTLDNAAEVDAVLLPGLQKFGYSGIDIKHIIITHEHFDHYGGARYLQERFSPAVYASGPAWDGMADIELDADPMPPTKDKTLFDGQDLTIGNVNFHIVMTPGHTPGTLSLIFPLRDAGEPHLAGLSGGTATPIQKALREQKIVSQNRFADIARDKGVDTLIANHHVADHALWHADLLRHRSTDAPNPFVVGVENFEKYMRINAISTQIVAAREGMDLGV